MQLLGTSIIGYDRGQSQPHASSAIDPATGDPLEPPYSHASESEITDAIDRATAAFHDYRERPGSERARFLRAAADHIAARSDELATRTPAETGLPEPRVRNETGRACAQLRLFADLIDEGSWVDARIDRPDPSRTPAPKPDTRSLWQPIGPVAVFGASNFPLAFSVAGGDTASALAAGNPVIVKAHHAHPGTAEIVGSAVAAAARECGLPDGVFSVLYGSGRQLGAALVAHPRVRAVGFTGSQAGGRALMDLAGARPDPIPVYAEMSSINPVFLLPGAVEHRGPEIAAGLCASVTLGVGQFCTNPGLVFVEAGEATEAFVRRLAEVMADTTSAPMLTPGIKRAYTEGVEAMSSRPNVEMVVAPARQAAGPGGCHAAAGLFRTTAKTFLSDPSFHREIFGPSTLVVVASNRAELLAAAADLEGQLTATVHAQSDEWTQHAELLRTLTTKVGRLVANGFPTGVEVCHSMVHGGPYPATSDGSSTSVGTRAILRFCRQVCYQDMPHACLPAELQDQNPRGIWRLVDGEHTRDAL